VVTAHDDEEYADQFLARAAAAKVPAEEISIAEALRREPRLDPRIKRAFAVEDGTVDGWQMTWGAIRSAQALGLKAFSDEAKRLAGGAINGTIAPAPGGADRLSGHFLSHCAASPQPGR